ncbi:rubredoxin [Clostridium oceanicum]|uniref:Rubredoxin n=1 Tax=Clostridium oceanicum TaxID=1543 RepID=A0ABP3UQ50_9CLOT
MEIYICNECGYIYNPNKGDTDNGIKPNTPFEELPHDWFCPICSKTKENESLKSA